MGRKRKIPIESKTYKYLYFIKVNLKGKDILKFGISNNVIRRMTEYDNSETVGKLKEVLNIFKCDYPKRVETFIKWKIRKWTKPVFSQEYFGIEFYDRAKTIAKEFMDDLGYKMIETSIDEIKKKKHIEI